MNVDNFLSIKKNLTVSGNTILTDNIYADKLTYHYDTGKLKLEGFIDVDKDSTFNNNVTNFINLLHKIN